MVWVAEVLDVVVGGSGASKGLSAVFVLVALFEPASFSPELQAITKKQINTNVENFKIERMVVDFIKMILDPC
jgi:hypothetical protein